MFIFRFIKWQLILMHVGNNIIRELILWSWNLTLEWTHELTTKRFEKHLWLGFFPADVRRNLHNRFLFRYRLQTYLVFSQSRQNIYFLFSLLHHILLHARPPIRIYTGQAPELPSLYVSYVSDIENGT